MSMECGLWYAKNGEIRKGLRTRSMKSPNVLLANPTWNGEFHQVEWRWAYSWTRIGGDCIYDGFLRILFRKPARGRQIDMSAVRGTVVIGTDEGYFRGMKCSKADGQWSWEIDVDWHEGHQTIWDSSMFLYSGVASDAQGNPFIGCEAIEDTGFRGDTIHVVGKRDSDKLTRGEERRLGVEMTASEFKHYANKKFGKEHHVVVSDYEDSSENDDDEEEM